MSSSTTATRTPFDTPIPPPPPMPHSSSPSPRIPPLSTSVLSALLFHMKQLSSELASRDAAQSAAITAVSDRLNRLEHSRSDRSNRESANLQSVPLPPPQPATVVVESHESRRDRAHTHPENAVLDPMRYCGLLPVPSANHSRDSDWYSRDASRPFVLPPYRHAGFVATALPQPHAGFASLPPPPIPQPLPSHSLVPQPMPSLPFAHESYPSLAPLSVSLPCSMPSMLPYTSQSYPNAVAGIAWDATDRATLLKAASRQRFTETSSIKIRAFLADAELFLTLCSRPRDRWGFIVLAWLGSEEAEEIRRSYVVDTVASYEKFRDGLIALFGRFVRRRVSGDVSRPSTVWLRIGGCICCADYRSVLARICRVLNRSSIIARC